MPYATVSDLPDSVRNRLNATERRTWLRVFNRTYRQTSGSDSKRESAAFRAANAVIRNMGMKKGFTKRIDVEKVDDEQRMVWGWAYVCQDENGEQVVDHSGEAVELSTIQKAAENFILQSRRGGVMHRTKAGFVCQSIVVTDEIAKALGITSRKRGWFIGFKVTDDETWEKVKTGKLRAFSIGGNAAVEEVGDAAA